MEAPPTPGRPVFRFSDGNLSRKSIPSKWDDAEKWLTSSSCRESPAHVTKVPDSAIIARSNGGLLLQQDDAFAEKLWRADEKKATNFHRQLVSLSSDSAFNGLSSKVQLEG